MVLVSSYCIVLPARHICVYSCDADDGGILSLWFSVCLRMASACMRAQRDRPLTDEPTGRRRNEPVI